MWITKKELIIYTENEEKIIFNLRKTNEVLRKAGDKQQELCHTLHNKPYIEPILILEHSKKNEIE